MNHDRTYRPVRPVPASRLRDADGSLRQALRRSAGYAVTHPVPPLKGLPGTRTTDVSYRALAPGGAGIGHRICTGASVSRLTANYSLLTANSTFTFSAKEKDSETGLSYFGSRYYSSDLSIWLSVDPMSDKYPSLSPYTYCADNLVKLVDPNGEEIGNYYNIDGDYLGTDGIDDCKTYLVWNLQDISFDENGKIVPQEINDIVELPSQEVRQQMIILMKEFDANNPNAEWGGLCGNNMYDDGSISDYYSIRWGTPGEAVPCGKGDKMHYNPKSAKRGWFHVALEFHTHGSGICENNIFWDQRPSDDDIDFCKNWAVWTGRSAKSAVFGMKDNVIHFYNEDRAISKPMSFDVFLSIPDNW